MLGGCGDRGIPPGEPGVAAAAAGRARAGAGRSGAAGAEGSGGIRGDPGTPKGEEAPGSGRESGGTRGKNARPVCGWGQPGPHRGWLSSKEPERMSCFLFSNMILVGL